jgi:hypothetical protein
VTILRALARYAAAAPDPARPGERCDLCGAALGDEHAHLFEPERRALRCACRACALLFTDRAGGARYRTVPDRVLVDPSFALDEAAWSALQIPVGLAFLYFSSTLRRQLACYPSPGGPIESEPPPEAWSAIAARTRLAGYLEPDVEALLVRRSRRSRSECILAPIDACYRLVAIVRLRWKGFEGGDDASRAIDRFFDELRARGRPLDGGPAPRGASAPPPDEPSGDQP